MSNHATPTETSRSSHSTSKLSATPELYQAGYQQALHDFAILPLLHRLQAYSDANFDVAWVALTPQEAEAIAVLLIQTLTADLDGELLATYLNAIRGKTSYASPSLATLHLPPPTTDLPESFPDVEMPRFLYGDRLYWLSDGERTDWGIAIGRFYSFAPHCCRWRWCYLIWLDPDSPSSAWIKADIAWEEDLQPLEAEAVG
jgi:hypothetical protein